MDNDDLWVDQDEPIDNGWWAMIEDQDCQAELEGDGNE